MASAIGAARSGAHVLICEKMQKLGKKVRISGNGRCNLTNDKLDASCFNPEAKTVVESVLSQFGRLDILKFFKDLGLRLYSDKEGRVFPVTNQAASVLDALELELSRLGIEVRCDSPVLGIKKTKEGFTLDIPSGPVHARHVVLAAGGRSYPVYGTDGSAYALAAAFGHTLVETVPITVPLTSDDPWCKELSGQKIQAAVRYEIDGVAGQAVEHDLLFTDYGLSGLAVFDSSDQIAIALHRSLDKTAALRVDLLPFIHIDELQKELARRLRRNFPSDKLLMGLLPPKFSRVLEEVLNTRNPLTISAAVKDRRFKITGTRGWPEAEFTAGGVNLSEIHPKTLGSKKCPGLFFAGEILDVNGRRGGFNLAWAWSSGTVAGRSAAAKP